MKNKFTLSFFLTLVGLSVNAQRFNWSSSSGYPAINNSYFGAVDLSSDAQGNIYTFDYANLDQVCQEDTIALSSSGYNLFVYKFNPDGDLIWSKAFGPGPGGGSIIPLNLELGPNNKLYALVHINANDIISEDSTFSVNAPSNVILCIDENGTLEWVQNTGFSCPPCLMLEIANNRIYYQAGHSLIKSMDFTQQADTQFSFYFDPGTAIFTLPIQGTAQFGNGDILLAGLQRGNSSFFEGDTLFQVDNPFLYCNITYARLTADLQPVWAKTFGSLHDPETHFIPLAVDENNQIYTAWEVMDTISIEGTEVNGGFNNWAGSILSMDENGNPLWLRELVSENSMQMNYLIADDERDVVWFTGFGSSATTIGDSLVLPGVNGSPILTAVNNAGQFSRQTTLANMPGGSKGRSLAKGINGQYFLGGNLNSGMGYSINCIDFPGNKGLYVAGFLDLPQIPPTPTVAIEGSDLVASPDFSGNIEWFLNGTLIDGANQQTLAFTQSGNYSVVYSYDFGCTAEAASEIIFVETGIQNHTENDIVAFPNPTQNHVILKGLEADKTNFFSLFSASGQLLKSGQLSNNLITLENLPCGLYLLHVQHNGKLIQERVLKIN